MQNMEGKAWKARHKRQSGVGHEATNRPWSSGPVSCLAASQGSLCEHMLRGATFLRASPLGPIVLGIIGEQFRGRPVLLGEGQDTAMALLRETSPKASSDGGRQGVASSGVSQGVASRESHQAVYQDGGRQGVHQGVYRDRGSHQGSRTKGCIGMGATGSPSRV